MQSNILVIIKVVTDLLFKYLIILNTVLSNVY